jgi:hypothetical protein
VKIPTTSEAELLLKDAEDMNPGLWAPHSRNVAKAAQIIADLHPQLDPDVAYIFGLLHDIGRREGRTDMRHILDGYTFLHNLGFDDVARISLTHGFPIPDLNVYMGEHDCTPEGLKFIEDFISSNVLTEYDMLIQLCDGISSPTGFCLLEKRMVDVAMRYGINDKTISGWQARFQTKQMFEDAIGCSIYQVLPGIIETTFGVRFDGKV